MKYLIPSLLIAVTTGLIFNDILPVWAGIVWVASAWYLLMQIKFFKPKK